jgi:hypothetical protein
MGKYLTFLNEEIIKSFTDIYDPRRLTKLVDSYLKENSSKINNFGSTEEGVGYYKNNIVFELKNGDLVYMDSPNNITRNLIKISSDDPKFEKLQESLKRREKWIPRGSSA